MKLEKQDLDDLVSLTEEARMTPMIYIGTKSPLSEPDESAKAWERVRAKWREGGMKYGFEPTKIRGIDSKTGEVRIEEREVRDEKG